MVRFTVNIDTRDRSFYVWDAVNVKRVGNGKGEELSFLAEQDATTVRDEMTARVALVSAEVDPNTGAPKDSDNDGGYDHDDYPSDPPMLLSATSVTMRGLFG